jgi:hypothetical protein
MYEMFQISVYAVYSWTPINNQKCSQISKKFKVEPFFVKICMERTLEMSNFIILGMQLIKGAFSYQKTPGAKISAF